MDRDILFMCKWLIISTDQQHPHVFCVTEEALDQINTLASETNDGMQICAQINEKLQGQSMNQLSMSISYLALPTSGFFLMEEFYSTSIAYISLYLEYIFKRFQLDN